MSAVGIHQNHPYFLWIEEDGEGGGVWIHTYLAVFLGPRPLNFGILIMIDKVLFWHILTLLCSSMSPRTNSMHALEDTGPYRAELIFMF